MQLSIAFKIGYCLPIFWKFWQFVAVNMTNVPVILRIGLISICILLLGVVLFFFALNRDHRPNVILIVVDTLRADYLGAYGFQGNISPNIDRFASNSVMFTRAFSNAPWTKPSVATLFTALAPEEHGVLDYKRGQHQVSSSKQGYKGDVLDDNFSTLAEKFRDKGYSTSAFVGNHLVSRRFGYAQGFDSFHEAKGYRVYSDEKILADAKAWLMRRAPGEQPFFLYLHFMDVHGPYAHLKEDFEALKSSTSLGSDLRLTKDKLPHKGIVNPAAWIPNDALDSLRSYRALYASGVRRFDRMFGKLERFLIGTGIQNDTFVIFTSDHGEELYEHGRWDHGYSLHDKLVRVPLIIRPPSVATNMPPRRISSPFSLLDLSSGLVKLLNGNMKIAEFVNELDTLDSNNRPASQDGQRKVFFSGQRNSSSALSIYWHPFKLIEDREGRVMQLFNLEKDPAEKLDLSKANPAALNKLRSQIKSYRASFSGKAKFLTQQRQYSKQEVERLKTLGYLK